MMQQTTIHDSKKRSPNADVSAASFYLHPTCASDVSTIFNPVDQLAGSSSAANIDPAAPAIAAHDSMRFLSAPSNTSLLHQSSHRSINDDLDDVGVDVCLGVPVEDPSNHSFSMLSRVFSKHQRVDNLPESIFNQNQAQLLTTNQSNQSSLSALVPHSLSI